MRIGGRSSLSFKSKMVTPPMTKPIMAIAQNRIVRSACVVASEVAFCPMCPNTLNVCARITKNGIDAK